MAKSTSQTISSIIDTEHDLHALKSALENAQDRARRGSSRKETHELEREVKRHKGRLTRLRAHLRKCS